MEKQFYCSDFDSDLKESIPHLNKYPSLLPFIGKSWNQQGQKILFVGESHYLDTQFNGLSKSETWYNLETPSILPQKNNWANTRGVFNSADRYGVDKEVKYSKGHSIFYNIKKAAIETLQIKNHKQYISHNFAFYNYFQRPAEKKGDSIKNDKIDDQFAYNTLMEICRLIQPTTIIFLSKKAFTSFKSVKQESLRKIDDVVKIYQLPHPGCAWWKKTSIKYPVDKKPASGKNKFIHIIKEIKLELILN
jgi:hypothetical protein